MSAEHQLTLKFEHRVALAGEDFLVSDCNRDAIDWIDAWPAWPAPALAIVGPAGSGKTHISAVFANKSGAQLIEVNALEASAAHIESDVIVEDVETILDDQHEEPLLHLYNAVHEAGYKLLLTAQHPPSRWGVQLPDLRSRLNAALTVEIGPPEDTLISALLVKLFMDRQLQVSDDVIAYTVSRMERSFLATRQIVAAADEMALVEKKSVTIPLMKRVLALQNSETGEGS